MVSEIRNKIKKAAVITAALGVIYGGGIVAKNYGEYRKLEKATISLQDDFSKEYIKTILENNVAYQNPKEIRDTQKVVLQSQERLANEFGRKERTGKSLEKYSKLYKIAEDIANLKHMSLNDVYIQLITEVADNRTRIGEKIRHQMYEKRFGKNRLENKVLKSIITFGILGGLAFFSPNITGNTIGNISNITSNVVGLVFVVLGVVGIWMFLKK